MSKKVTKRFPELRFPKFDRDWEFKYLNQIGDFKNGFNAGKQAFGTGTEFVNLMDVFGKSEIRKTHLERVEIEAKQLEQYKIKKGDVLFVRSSVKREGVGQSCLVNYNFDNTVYSGFIIRFRDNSSTLNHLYKKYCFSTPSFRKKLLSLATSSANTNINQDSLSKIPLIYPKVEEQEKIASFLGAVDTRLTQLRRKQELLQTYKRGVMQKIFSQEIRFKQKDGKPFPDWQKKNFGDMATKVSSKYDPNDSNINYPCIELESIASEQGKLIKIFDSKEQQSIKSKFNSEDVLFGKLRPYLRKFLFVNFKGVCSTEIWVLRGKTILNRYLYYLVQTDRFSKISNVSFGSKMPRSDWGFISTFSFQFPCEKEQEKIANFLTAIDKKIEAVSLQIEKTELFKKGLLQKMFV